MEVPARLVASVRFSPTSFPPVVIVPAHPTAVNAAIRRLHDARIPLFGLVNRFSEPEVLTGFVTSDDYALGLDVAVPFGAGFDARAGLDYYRYFSSFHPELGSRPRIQE